MIDESRDKRQNETVDKFIVNNGRACMQFPTGWGKTTLAFKVIKRFNKDKLVHIVVPTRELKLQWEEKLHQVENKVEVFVVNSYVSQKRKCDLLINDEAHRFSNIEAKVFNKVLEVSEYKWVLCLSATYTKEQLNFLNSYKIPLVDSISVQEAKAKKWIANSITYNLGLELTEEELKKYTTATNIMKAHAPYLEGLNPFTALKNKVKLKEFCEENGYDFGQMGRKITKYNVATQTRKSIIYGAESKIKIISEIVNRIDKQTILFSETKKYAELIHKLIPNSVLYHSTISDNKKKEALDKIKSGSAKLLCTAKALDEGLNIPNLKVGITASGTSVERQAKQREGRIGRFVDDQVATMINLYIKGTVEESWLKKRQKNITNIEWINSVDEILI